MVRRIVPLLASLLVAPATATAQTTLLFLDSQPGDFVGGGVQQTFTVADGNFVASRNFDNGVSVRFQASDFSHFWFTDFAAPGDAPLTPGVYEGAGRFPFQGPAQPGLSVTGDGRGCNTVTGRFEVFEATYGPTGDVVSFAAAFEQHCEGNTSALLGFVLFNSPTPVPPKVTLTLTGCTHCHAGDRFIVQGRLTNAGSMGIPVEFKLGLRMPGGTGASLFGPNGQHLVITLPSGLDSTFPVLDILWPAGAPAGAWHVEGTLFEAALGKTFSRDVKVFEVEP